MKLQRANRVKPTMLTVRFLDRKVLIVALFASLFVWVGSPASALEANVIAQAGFQAKEQRDYSSAIKLFDEALRIGGFDQEQTGFLLYSRGVSYEGLGNRDRALVDLDAAIALLPNFANPYIYRGLIWTQYGRYDRAVDDLIKARGLSPNDPLIHNNLGGAYEKKGDLSQALESYNKALQLRPAYAEAYYNRAQIFLAQGDHAARASRL